MSETIPAQVPGVDMGRSAQTASAPPASRPIPTRTPPSRRSAATIGRILVGFGWDLDWNWPALVLPGDMDDVVGAIIAGVRARQSNLLLTLNLDIWRQLTRQPRVFMKRPNYDSVLLDGAPIVWAYEIATRSTGHRVTGADLLPELSFAAIAEGLHVHFSGGGLGVAEEVSELFGSGDAPGRTSASAYTFGPDLKNLAIAARAIAALKPDIVFLAYGFPKQDAIAEAVLAEHPGVTVVGVGAAFDFALGRFARAPRAVQMLKMEWVVRLLQEPRRLASRYLKHGLPAVLPLVRASLRLRARCRSGAS